MATGRVMNFGEEILLKIFGRFWKMHRLRKKRSLGFIQKIFKEEFPLRIKAGTPRDVRTYGVDFLIGTRHGYCQKYRKIYWDAPCGIVLLHIKDGKTREIACVGFKLNANSVRIVQLQGVREEAEALRGIRWEQMLIQLVVEYAKHFNFKKVCIVSAKQNQYYEGYGNKNNIEHHARLIMRYDVTARRCGFIPGKEFHTLRLC